MYFLYNLLVLSASTILRVLALLNSKLSLFVKGRKETRSIIQSSISKKDRVIWIHAASLGEYEQGLPVMENLKRNYPTHKIVLTFFSPSGYEVKKNSKAADVICYLPMDTKKNVSLFLEATHPELAIFIKYEIWPNYLSALKDRAIPTFLISAIFKENQIYFKWYGSFMRTALTKFTHFFVQNEKSNNLLNTIGFQNVTIAGDTRFDRVSEILDRDNSLDFMSQFKQSKFCFVAGSTWPEDEKIIMDYINQNDLPIQFVIAPHTIKPKHIEVLKQGINKPTLCYSELNDSKIEDFDVLIIDTIGLLTKIYSYADVAYVGGGFETGLHNTLEPAVFGIPVIIGPEFKGFAEAENLVQLEGILSINNASEFHAQLNGCYENENFKHKTGQINYTYIQEQKGATQKIVRAINSVFK
ncbi:3-deoxy-D-manno-octulosonic acid transferase [Maribacter sp. ACAM166]|uniref:3-deoxy-D-manno-octulosonic acid transferase n=1 Tax=Maribacter sp. ACAM166 TaxID=2508996 RepID=UPI0010FED11B|nr:glycosyltransferase N-terminal domain-containing protein [Maribacter sp. ACAM166]TLP82333.1 3-deoxy-D-manno-octulosonic acid transferase [Maribacter sp. ACAM166]